MDTLGETIHVYYFATLGFFRSDFAFQVIADIV